MATAFPEVSELEMVDMVEAKDCFLKLWNASKYTLFPSFWPMLQEIVVDGRVVTRS